MARTDRHGIHEVKGPRLVGGAGYLAPRFGLFTHYLVLQHIRSEKAFRDYLELREEAAKMAVNELVSAFNSPVDLFFLADLDVDIFQRRYSNHRAFVDQHSVIANCGSMILNGESNASDVDNISTNRLLKDECIRHKNNKAELLDKLYGVRRYSAYRKSLLKLDFIKWNSDPEEVLKRIKSSNQWSHLNDRELKLGLKSHMDLLKEHTSKLGSTSGSCSVSEFENIALERINYEMGSKIEELLYEPEKGLMYEYFYRMSLRNVARECSNQVEKTGIILVQEFMPVRVPVKEQVVQTIFPWMKQAMEQSVEGLIGYLRGGGAARGEVKYSVEGWMGYRRGGGIAGGRVKHSVEGWMAYLHGGSGSRRKAPLPALGCSILGVALFGVASYKKLRTAA